MGKGRAARRDSAVVRGAVSVMTTAIGWSLFSYWLGMEGHRPSGPSLFEEQYRTQALLLPGILLAGWAFYCGFLWKIFGEESTGVTRGDWMEGLGGIYSNGYFLLWILPDVAAYLLGDFSTLTQIAPFLPVLTTLFVVALSVQYIGRRVSVPRWKRSAWVVFAWIVQSIPLLAFVR
jgi:hypothetical protein